MRSRGGAAVPRRLQKAPRHGLHRGLGQLLRRLRRRPRGHAEGAPALEIFQELVEAAEASRKELSPLRTPNANLKG